MHLKRIELTNFRQHRRLDVDFSGNMIAIVGRNGLGKSNLIGAIQFALTGEQPGFTKADLTTWGEKEGSVKLEFTAGSNDTDFVIVRKTNGDVTLKFGNETVKQARKVEEALRDKAGLDKELIRQIVFVPQKGIDAILFDDPKNREVAFQRLIGIGNANKIYDSLRTEIAAYDKPQGFDEAIARSRQQLSEQSDMAKRSSDAIRHYEEALNELPPKEHYEEEVDRLAGAQVCVEEFISVCAKLESSQNDNEKAMKTVADLGAVSEDEEEELRKKVDEARDVVRFLSRLKELSDAAVKSKEALDSAARYADDVHGKNPVVAIDEERDALKELEARRSSADAEARSLRNMMKEASSDGTCPLCGASATHEDIEAHVRGKLEKIDSERNELSVKCDEASAHLRTREREESDADRKLDVAKTRYESARSAIESAKSKNVNGVCIDMDTFEVSYKGHSTSEIDSLEKSLSDDSARLEDAVKRKGAAKDARDAVARLAAQIELLSKKKLDLASRLSGIGIDPETVGDDSAAKCRAATAKARTNLDAYNGIIRDLAAEKGKAESIEETIAKTRKFIDDLVEKKEQEDSVRTKVDTLKRVRDWFHYREGPRIMSQNVMHDLTACVNNFLDQFCAPFVVEAEEEGFGFRCSFIDGRAMPDPHPDASLLSGGQKVALAIAFRLAIYMCFGCELGLLSLDEPTAYLDDASIGHLGELLQKVGEIARNKGLQILMATHEKAIMPYLDTKIDLETLVGKE